MSYTQPDLSEILSNEQTINTKLIELRSILRNKLSLRGISYEESDSIPTLISKLNGGTYWILTKNSSLDVFNETIIIQNSRYIGWTKDSEGYYLQSLSSQSGSNPALGVGLFSNSGGNVKGSVNFNMRIFIKISQFINGGFSGVGITLGTPSAEQPFYGVFFGAYQNSSGEVYPATMKFKNSMTPTITIVQPNFQLPDSLFHIYLSNEYSASSGNIGCFWYDNVGTHIKTEYIYYTDFCETGSDMDTNIRFGVCNGAESIGRLSYIPRIILQPNSRIQF